MPLSKIKKRSVLIIDGSDSLLDLMELLLGGLGDIRVATTNSFEEGVDNIKSGKIDLVISDHCKKNKRNGLGFMREVSLHSPNTIRYLITCCLNNNELENHKKEGIIHRYSTLLQSNSDITNNVKHCLSLCESNWRPKIIELVN